MPDTDRPSRSEFDPVVDLARFGLDDENGRWVDRFREAEAVVELGCIGPYEILEEIGRGGQGVVYKAKQPGTSRIIAVKRMLGGTGATPGDRRRFDEEVRCLASLRHPNIVTVFAMDIIDGLPVLAMEWIDGRAVTSWAGGRSIGEKCAIAATTCAAVHHAHQRGIIHRDLKPSNILVDDEDQPRVLDFGLARLLERDGDNECEPAQFVGTREYAAPEQLQNGGKGVDTRADLFALGVILYEMLTGRLPDLSERHADDQPGDLQIVPANPPSSIDPAISRDLDYIVIKALAADPENRYPSVDAFGDDLRRFLRNDAVRAHPNSVGYQWRKFAWRHRLIFAAVLVGLTAISGFAAWAWQSRNEARFARDAEHRSRVISERVNAFLQATLSTALPSRGGADVTVLQAMADAGRRADLELADQPEVAAEVHYSIGATCNALWRWRDALPHLEKSVKLSKELGITEDAIYAARLVELGRTCTSLRRAEAVDLQQEALRLRQVLFGESHPLVAESLMRLAYALHQAAEPAQWAEAERYFGAALDMYRMVPGDHRRETASCLHNFGWMRYRQERYAEADDLYAEALALYRDLGNDKDPYQLELIHGYTSLLLLRKKYAESMALLDEAIPRVESVYGEAGAEPLYWRSAIAATHLHQIEPARRWYRTAMNATCESIIRVLMEGRGGSFDEQSAALVEELQAVRAAIATAGANELPPFPMLLELAGQFSEDRSARLNRYAVHFAAFAAACRSESLPPAE